jgi:penicillin amidase
VTLLDFPLHGLILRLDLFMKIVKFLISFAVTIAITVAFSMRFDSIPPLGKFLDPFNGFWQNAEGKMPDLDRNLMLSGLQSPVEVLYDSMMIPHIFADNEADLYFTQGYVMASLRLWQMEFVTHLASGRISEIVGERALYLDRLNRRKGLMYAAENNLREWVKIPEIRQAIDAYTAGVNTYISGLEYSDYPVEYKLLAYRPEAWTNLKSALLLSYMADMLAGGDADLENTNALRLLGKENFELLFQTDLPNPAPVIPVSKSWDFEPVAIDTPQVALADTTDFILQTIEKPDPDNGSNNWAVSGSKTRSGRPILSSDMHLGLNLPSIWTAMQLRAPGVNVFGVALPGVPLIICGFNDSIAWGPTNARRDVLDWYRINFSDASKTEYTYDGQLLKTQKRIEEIKIRDGAVFTDTVIYTHFGPVVYDETFPNDSVVNKRRQFAMKWAAHNPSVVPLTFYKLNRARNYQDYREALSHYSAPAQNFAFASAGGDIALWIQGRFPAKWKQQGKFLMEGTDSRLEWQQIIPFEHQAQVLNPERGFISSANQYPTGKDYPYYVYDHNYEDFRNRRINQRLEQMQNITPQDMMNLQNDTYNLQAAEALPYLLDTLELGRLSTEQTEAYEQLRKWNFYNNVNYRAPSLYEAWWSSFHDLLWDEFEGQPMELDKPEDDVTLYILKNYPDHEFIDLQQTSARETLQEIVYESFATAVKEMAEWEDNNEMEAQWGHYKNTTIRHMLRLEPFSIDKVQVGGGRNIIAANSQSHGQSWKMIVELGEQPQAWGVYPGGQSGNPGSRFYDHFVAPWASGTFLPMLFMQQPDDSPEKIMFRQNLNPAGQNNED